MGRKDGDGSTLVHYAARYGYVEKMKLLADRGADMTIESSQTRMEINASSCYYILYNSYVYVSRAGTEERYKVDFLTDVCVGIGIKNNPGKPPLYVGGSRWWDAKNRGKSHFWWRQSQHKRRQRTDSSTSYDLRWEWGDDKDDETTRTQWCRCERKRHTWEDCPVLIYIQGPISITKFLLDSGADINTPDYHNQMPLHVSANRSDIDRKIILIDGGADVNAVARNENTSDWYFTKCSVSTIIFKRRFEKEHSVSLLSLRVNLTFELSIIRVHSRTTV